MALGGIYIAIPQARDEVSWQVAKYKNSAESYAHYITKQPEGKHIKSARFLVEKKDWQKTQNADNVDAYELYLQTYPKGRYIGRAQEQLEQIRWDAAISQNDDFWLYYSFALSCQHCSGEPSSSK